VSERSPESALWNVLRGALGTRALALVADLGAADALAAGPRSVDDVAPELGADTDVLYRLLRALATDGIFAEDEPRVFRNTPASELLRSGSGWRDFANLFGGVWFRTLGELHAASAEPVFPRLYGTDFWTWLAQHPEQRAAFDRAMEQGNDGRAERLASAGWRGDETIVDVGGGNGSLLVALLRDRPGLRGIVFDLPETVRDDSTFGDRIEFVGGSFFERVPPGDVYILSTILHDWDDERAAKILRVVRAAASDRARLIVLDAVVPAGNEAGGGKWLDILMLALLGGRERDEAQWRELLTAGGWEPVRLEDGLIEARCL
jgi:hypothetical protein